MPRPQSVNLADLLHPPCQQDITGRISGHQGQDEDPGHRHTASSDSSSETGGAICGCPAPGFACLDFLRSLSVTSTIPTVTANVPAHRVGDTDSPKISQAERAVRTYVDAVIGST